MNPVLRKGVGVFLIVLGVIGLFVPILQGVLFILLGVSVLKSRSLRKSWKELKERRLKKKI